MIRTVKRNWLILPLLASLLIGGGLGILLALTQDLPQVESLADFEPSAITTVLADDGTPLRSFFVERRIPVPLGDMPGNLVKAIIAVEDARFYQHFGLDLRGIVRALLRDIRSLRVVEGGSTLTQQLAKVMFLTPEKTLVRKLREAVLAINIERRYSKDEILTLYLNQIYLGEGAYGVEAAARTYFNKSVSDLNLQECSLIAGLPRSPALYSPLANPDRATKRMEIVLRRLLEEGYISHETFLKAVESGVELRPNAAPEDPAPYFTEMVRREVEEKISPNLLYRGGLTIETTLNRDLQSAADEAVRMGLGLFERRHPPDDDEPIQASFVALDPATGEIKALLGGRDFMKSPYNRAVQARRQPGSSFKPILYAAALASGFTPADTLVDGPHEIPVPGRNDPWVPRNYTGEYQGTVTMRTALEKSLNAASVDLLLRLGYQPVIDMTARFGINSELKPYPSLALGTFDVSLLELVSAYGIFENKGIHIRPHLIKRVVDREGRIIWESMRNLSDALSPQVSFQITNLLEGVVTRGTGRRARALDRPVAGKTGTTDEFKDAWFIGFAPGLAAGVWVGYDLPRSLGEGEAGGRVALPIWVDFMKRALGDIPVSAFAVPDGIELVEIDPSTGLLAGPECPERVVEAFVPGTTPRIVCDHDSSGALTDNARN